MCTPLHHHDQLCQKSVLGVVYLLLAGRCSFHFYLFVCLYEFMCAMCMEVPTKIRGCPGPVVWIPWNWSHEWVWAAWCGASFKSNKRSLPLSHLSSLAQNSESQGGNEIKKRTVEQLDRDERSFMLTNWDKQSWKGIGMQGCPHSMPVYLKIKKAGSGLAWMRVAQERSNPSKEYGETQVQILF